MTVPRWVEILCGVGLEIKVLHLENYGAYKFVGIHGMD